MTGVYKIELPLTVMSKKRIRVLALRFLVVNVVFFSVKLTIDHDDSNGFFGTDSLYYYLTAFFLLMTTWEVNDWLIRRARSRAPMGSLGVKEVWAVLGISLLIMAPIVGLVYYLGSFELGFGNKELTAFLQWRQDFFRGMLIGTTVIVFNMMYHGGKQKQELEQRLMALNKEIMQSKYDSLKSQISPHFLFNSLNTLTSLMYQDRDLASDFVSRLASCYRYILDNRDQDVISLDKELAFLDSFMFMMQVRHDNALTISTDIQLDPTQVVVPTLSLQMLVENALKHNQYSPEKKLEILVYTKGTQRLVVRNNIQPRAQLEPSTGLGLQNIKKRYAFYTTQEVVVEERDGHFTVEMPLLRSEVIKPIKLSVS